MKKSSTIFLQTVIVLVGIAMLAFMLVMPHFEGVNANATSIADIYFDDPFLAYVYLGSIPFFFGLFQAIKVLGFVNKNNVFSQDAVNALRKIKYCAFITAGAIIAAGVFLRVAAIYHEDDPAGALMLGMIATLASIVVGTASALFERVLQKAVDMKSENDLTV